MALAEYPINDEWVAEMIWQFANPHHVRYDYGKLEMLNYFHSEWRTNEMAFFGDKEKNVLLRVEILSPLHVGVHVMGNGLNIRGVLREGIRKTFEEYKFDVILLTTLDKRLVSIQKAAGFRVVAEVPRHAYIDGKLHDVTLMQYTREMFNDARNDRLAASRVPQSSRQEAPADA